MDLLCKFLRKQENQNGSELTIKGLKLLNYAAMQLLEAYYFRVVDLKEIPMDLFYYNTIFESAENVDFICTEIAKYPKVNQITFAY